MTDTNIIRVRVNSGNVPILNEEIKKNEEKDEVIHLENGKTIILKFKGN